MEKFDAVCQDIIGISGERFKNAFQNSSFDFYKPNGDINMSKVSEMMGLLFKYKEKNPDATDDELLEYIDAYSSICEGGDDFYIFNNKDNEEIFLNLAMSRDSIYNPLKPIKNDIR